jgi:large subunit ribosomal protein L24
MTKYKRAAKDPVKTKIKKDDMVVVITGNDRGKSGKVLHVDKSRGRVIVEKINVVKKAQRPTQENQAGGFIEIEASVHLSNVMILDPKSGNPTRVGLKIEDGKKVRFAKKSGKNL